MRVTLWGTRGSVARAGPTTLAYGGDTASVEVSAADGTTVFLDAGSGIARAKTPPSGRVDVLLTHLHMDHIQGLGFCRPLFDPTLESHVWGPASTTRGLVERLGLYLSPPLFPVRIRDYPRLHVHDAFPGTFRIGSFQVTADLVCHPGPTLGYRIREDGGPSLAYLPDHEPALGAPSFPGPPEWTSGWELARRVDLLIHDAQYTEAEYEERAGWGHSTFRAAVAFAELAMVERMVAFHHDPDHSDSFLDLFFEEAAAGAGVPVVMGRQDDVFEV